MHSLPSQTLSILQCHSLSVCHILKAIGTVERKGFGLQDYSLQCRNQDIADYKSCNKQAEQCKTTINLSKEEGQAEAGRIIRFICGKSIASFPLFILRVARLLQSAVIQSHPHVQIWYMYLRNTSCIVGDFTQDLGMAFYRNLAHTDRSYIVYSQVELNMHILWRIVILFAGRLIIPTYLAGQYSKCKVTHGIKILEHKHACIIRIAVAHYVTYKDQHPCSHTHTYTCT